MASSTNSLSTSEYPVQVKETLVPPLEELSEALSVGLKKNFRDVSVSVVACPDLTQPPWHLAAPGLGGSPCLLDIGGPPYLAPVPDRSKLYDLDKMAAIANMNDAFIIGAGAASSKVLGVNAELMPNAKLSVDSESTHNCTHTAKVSTEDGSCVLEKYPSLQTGPLVNVLACKGEPGTRVLEIRAKCRTGEDDFVHALRRAVSDKYGQSPVAMGGVFLIQKGKAKLHVMPDFSCTPLNTNADVNNWLKFYELSAPLICLSEFVSHDPDLDLRIEHTHCFSTHGEGGHYHYDVTPDEVEYHALYTVAERIVRIDRPQNTHQIGRD